MRKSASRLNAAIDTVLAPGERLSTTGTGWAAQRRPKIPLLFQGRRQFWFVLTDRRLLVFARRHGGPTADDLVLGKRFSFFTLEKVHRHRPLFQIRVRGANDSRLVMEFRPGQRALASELTANLRRALPAPSATDPANTPQGTAGVMSPSSPTGADATAPMAPMSAGAPIPPAPGWSAPEAPAPAPERDADADTAAAFWGDR